MSINQETVDRIAANATKELAIKARSNGIELWYYEPALSFRKD